MFICVTKDAESVNNFVGHEGGVAVASTTVLVVVITLATLDVVGESLGHCRVFSVALHDVGHVIADHATKPTALVAHVRQVGAYIRRGGNTNLHTLGVTTSVFGRFAHCGDGPLGNREVGELQNEPVTNFASELQRLGAVSRHPHFATTLFGPRKPNGRAVVFHAAPID